MRRPRIDRDEVPLEMTPLIDVTFLLLVFFLCTLRFATLEGRLAAHLPRDGGEAQARDVPEERLDVRLVVLRRGEPRDPLDPERPWSGTGRHVLAGRELAWQVGPHRHATLDSAAADLERRARVDPDRRITLQIPPHALQSEAVALLDVLARAGFHDIAFARGPR